MRAFLRASHTAQAVSLVLALGAISCGKPARKPAPPTEPPPHVLVVGLERVALRSTAWVELHAWLAAAARSESELGDAVLDDSARRYATALRDDDDDAALAGTMRALSACADERCARSALTGTPFERAYLNALPTFRARRWRERAGLARTGVEAARVAMGPAADALVAELSRDLAIEWPSPPPIVDIVALSPPAGRDALVRPALAARSSCFVTDGKEAERIRDARVMDCVLFYAASRLESQSALYQALSKTLRPRDAERAWTALTAHAVAVRVTTWEPKHVSPPRQSVAAVERELLTWLVRHWPSRMSGEHVDVFAARYAEAFTSSRAR